MAKPLVWTAHAATAIRERELTADWVEQTVRKPEWTLADPDRPGIERRFRRIPEFGDRILRVAILESAAEIRILTAFFDRKARQR